MSRNASIGLLNGVIRDESQPRQPNLELPYKTEHQPQKKISTVKANTIFEK
jgi:hypothetical protein